jgi:hypothetical protein
MNYKVMFATFCFAISMVACTTAVPKVPQTQVTPIVEVVPTNPAPKPEPKPLKNLFVRTTAVKRQAEEAVQKLSADVAWVRQCPDGSTVPLTQVVSEEPYTGVVARGEDLWSTWQSGGAGDYAIVEIKDGLVTKAEPIGDIMPDQEITGAKHLIYNVCDAETGPWVDTLNPGDIISIDSVKLASDVHWGVECEQIVYPHTQITSLTPYTSIPAVGSNLAGWWKYEGVTQLRVHAVRGGQAYYVSPVDGGYAVDQQVDHDGIILIPQSCS